MANIRNVQNKPKRTRDDTLLSVSTSSSRIGRWKIFWRNLHQRQRPQTAHPPLPPPPLHHHHRHYTTNPTTTTTSTSNNRNAIFVAILITPTPTVIHSINTTKPTQQKQQNQINNNNINKQATLTLRRTACLHHLRHRKRSAPSLERSQQCVALKP